MSPCPVPDCPNPVRPAQLMCSVHWFRVPTALRNRVWREYRLDDGSPEHTKACGEAIHAAAAWQPKART